MQLDSNSDSFFLSANWGILQKFKHTNPVPQEHLVYFWWYSAEIITSIFHEVSYSLPMIVNPPLNMLTAVLEPCAVIIPGYPAGASEILNTEIQPSSY